MTSRQAWASSRRGSRQSRGYGRAHDKMRERVLAEEPLCRECTRRGIIEPTTIADHIIPKAEGGSDDRDNYQGLCDRCSKAKTAIEAARAQGRREPTPQAAIGEDGWPVEG